MVHTPTVPQGPLSGRPRRSGGQCSSDLFGLQWEAEAVLRDLAFVLQATRSVKEALLAEKAAEEGAAR